jgi:RNA polymerase sigma-70 factor (ECF subfamily)
VDAYTLFYKENKDRLFAYLLRMTGDDCLAADLVQEAFARYLGRYANEGASRPLLYTIARNAAVDAIRKHKPEWLDEGNHEDPHNNPEQQVIARQAINFMLAAIGRLAPLDRELISLVATADLTYREIGKVLNISEANVKVKVHRARTKLREILASGGG